MFKFTEISKVYPSPPLASRILYLVLWPLTLEITLNKGIKLERACYDLDTVDLACGASRLSLATRARMINLARDPNRAELALAGFVKLISDKGE